MTPTINPNDLMIVSRTHYNDLQRKVQQGFDYAMQKDNKIEELEQIIYDQQKQIDEFKQFCELFKKFMQKLVDKQ